MVHEHPSVLRYTYIAWIVKNYASFGIVLTTNGRLVSGTSSSTMLTVKFHVWDASPGCATQI